jgi:glyoxalase family protein
MKLDGMHHITMITGNATKNVDFYADVLGLRLVKKTVNFDAPEAYHLYFGDERGSPGSILTWFEFAGAWKGRPGAGMIHTIQLGVASEASLDFWAERLHAKGYASERTDRGLAFEDYDGLRFELVVADDGNPPLRAEHPEVPAEHAILGDERHFHWAYDVTDQRGHQGAGTVHHIAWHSRDEDHVAWQQRVGAAGMHVTPVIDRDYFKAIYFNQPQGILFEIATTSPGFAVDEDPERLGEELRLPTHHEHLRPQLERVLTPLANPRAAARTEA